MRHKWLSTLSRDKEKGWETHMSNLAMIRKLYLIFFNFSVNHVYFFRLLVDSKDQEHQLF